MALTNYLTRYLNDRLTAFLEQFPVVLLSGARQVGKTTFLSNQLPGWRRIDLEDAGLAGVISEDPALFLRDHPDKVWFDEAQRVPELFPALRVAVDGDRRPGRFVLSGSASGALTKGVSESLAGRAGVLHLHHLTASEALERTRPSFLPALFDAKEAGDLLDFVAPLARIDPGVFNDLWLAGGFPEPWRLGDPNRRSRWFQSYVRLLSERDLQVVKGALRPVAVRRLLRMLAARHGQLQNQSDLARDFGVSSFAMGEYLDVLEGAFLLNRLEPYTENIGKRIVRSPKSWIADAGLMHDLSGISVFDDLDVHPAAGSSFEGWVIQNLRAQADLLDRPPRFHHWRTHGGAEVDLVLEWGPRLVPIEIKRTTRLGGNALRGMRSFLASFPAKTRFGVVLYNGPAVRIALDIVALPVDMVV